MQWGIKFLLHMFCWTFLNNKLEQKLDLDMKSSWKMDADWQGSSE